MANLFGRMVSLGKRKFNLNDLRDVDTSGVADGEALIYDSATGTYVPGAAGGSAAAQVSGGEITAGTETELRSYSPADVKSFVDQHGPTDAEIETAYNNQVGIVSQGDAEAGTSTTAERWTPERVAQAIAALATGAVASVNGNTGTVVLGPTDMIDGDTVQGSDPSGASWAAGSSNVTLLAGGIAENEYTFLAPSGESAGMITVVINKCGAAATIKGVTGGDITLADDKCLLLAYGASAWYRPDFTA